MGALVDESVTVPCRVPSPALHCGNLNVPMRVRQLKLLVVE
jgi:hypothetical protein